MPEKDEGEKPSPSVGERVIASCLADVVGALNLAQKEYERAGAEVTMTFAAKFADGEVKPSTKVQTKLEPFQHDGKAVSMTPEKNAKLFDDPVHKAVHEMLDNLKKAGCTSFEVKHIADGKTVRSAKVDLTK